MKKSKIYRMILVGIFLIGCILMLSHSLIRYYEIKSSIHKMPDPKQKMELAVQLNSKILVEEAVKDGYDFYQHPKQTKTIFSEACMYAGSEVTDLIMENSDRKKYSRKQQDLIMAKALCYQKKAFLKKMISDGYEVNDRVFSYIQDEFLIKDHEGRAYPYMNDRQLMENIRYLKACKNKYLAKKEDIGIKMLKKGCICYGAAFALLDEKNIYRTFLNGRTEVVDEQKMDREILSKLVSAFGDETLYKKLQAHGIRMNEKDALGSSMLMIACQYGNTEMIDYFLSQGLKADDWNDDENDCLMESILYNQEKSVRCLLEKKAVNVQEEQDATELMKGMAYWDNRSIFQQLEKHGLKVNQIQTDCFHKGEGNNILSYLAGKIDHHEKAEVYRLGLWSAEAGNINILEQIRKKGTDLNLITDDIDGIEDADGKSLLDIAIQHSDYDLVKYLLKCNVTKREKSNVPDSEKIREL